MTRNVSELTDRGAGGHIYAAVSDGGRVRLVCLGDHATVRYRYNQIACLVAGKAIATLRTYGPAAGRVLTAATKPPGYWVDTQFGGAPVETPESLFNLAARGPSPDADKVGCLAFGGYWPQDMLRIPGMQPFDKCMSESLGRVFYDCLLYPGVRVGTSAEQTVVRRTHEAITAAKRAGYEPADEPGLLWFLEMLNKASFLQFFHEVNPA